MVETYFFDVEKCKIFPLKSTCYKEGTDSKTYSVSINQISIKIIWIFRRH